MKIKKLFVCLSAFMASNVMMGDTVLKITDGEKDYLMSFGSEPTVTYVTDKIVITSTEETIEIPVTKDVTFLIVEDTKIEKPSCSTFLFSFTVGEIILQGLKSNEELTVCTIDGTTVLRCRTNEEGVCRIDRSSLPHGILVFHGKDVSFKLTNR